MIKYTLNMRFFGIPIHTVSINCSRSEPESFKKRLAFEECVRNGLSLEGVNLRGANLSEMNLSRMNLKDADLMGAVLNRSNLSETNLTGADLDGASLDECLLNKTQLIRASLYCASINYTKIKEANLTEAYLTKASFCGSLLESTVMRGANLGGADMRGVRLKNVDIDSVKSMRGTIADGRHIKSTNILIFPVLYTATMLQIAGDRHPHDFWWQLNLQNARGNFIWSLNYDTPGLKEAELLADNWAEWRDWLRDLIEVRSPAEPTK